MATERQPQRAQVTDDVLRQMAVDAIRSMHDSNFVSERELAAYHEAGHAVAGVFFGIDFDHISIIPDRETQGRVVLGQSPPHRREGFDLADPWHRKTAEEWIVFALTGEVAQAYGTNRVASLKNPEADGDYQPAAELAGLLCGEPGRIDLFLEEMQRRAEQFVSERWRQISSVATDLRMLNDMDRDQVARRMDEMAGTIGMETGGYDSPELT